MNRFEIEEYNNIRNRDANRWWSSCKVTAKEIIALACTLSEDAARYPACTIWWNNLSLDSKIEVQNKFHDIKVE